MTIVYVGLTRDTKMVEALRAAGIGRIQQRGQLDMNALWAGERWALDNGAFTDWTGGKPFDEEQWCRDVDAVFKSEHWPTLVVCPDLVAQGERSLDFSLGWAARLPKKFTLYLAVQDGMREESVRLAFSERWFRGLFLGGSDKFKNNEALKWCELAHNSGVPAHYGRASTPRKIAHARECGYDSLDSSFPLWTRDRFSQFLMLVGAYNPQRKFSFSDEAWPPKHLDSLEAERT